MKQMTLLLRKFNNSGLLADFPFGLNECSALDPKTLRALARDPTSQLTCPGPNDSCATAEAVIFQSKIDPIFHIPTETPIFKGSIQLFYAVRRPGV